MANNVINRKSVNTPKAKPAFFNTMFSRSSHYLLFAMLLVAIGLITFTYFDEIKGAGSQIKHFVKKVVVPLTTADYQQTINQTVADYFAERSQLSNDESSYQDGSNINDRENLIKQTIDRITDLSVTEQYKDFHLSLVLSFKQIESSEVDFINSIKYRYGLSGHTIDTNQADQLKQISLTIYQNATQSLDSLAQKNQWFKYQ